MLLTIELNQNSFRWQPEIERKRLHISTRVESLLPDIHPTEGIKLTSDPTLTTGLTAGQTAFAADMTAHRLPEHTMHWAADCHLLRLIHYGRHLSVVVTITMNQAESRQDLRQSQSQLRRRLQVAAPGAALAARMRVRTLEKGSMLPAENTNLPRDVDEFSLAVVVALPMPFAEQDENFRPRLRSTYRRLHVAALWTTRSLEMHVG